ncbi:MAG TPA: 7TM diverse intracellular signaling domain-containing protein, partial [Leptospiraceae bacterium]|nr:7TM diverse intracellular signaling domain-containing protein [Leptospiraceae bacterium]
AAAIGGGQGFGTYRIQIRTTDQDLALSTMEQGTSVRVYANGKLICEAGAPGSNRDTTIAHAVPLLCDIGRVSNALTLTLEIANFNYRKGGMWNAPVIGPVNAVRRDFYLRRDLELMLSALLFVMSMYHVMLYVYRRVDLVPLVFGLFAFAVFLRTISTNFRILTQYAPFLPFEFYNRLELLSWFWIPPLALEYTSRIFSGRIPSRTNLVFGVLAILESLFLVLPPALYSYVVFPSQILSVAVLVLCIYIPWAAMREGHPGAAAFLFSSLVAVACVTNDLLYTNEVIRTAQVGPYGLFFVIIAHSLILSHMLMRTYKLLVQSDSRYRIMIEGSRRMVFALDRQFRFTSANRTVSRTLGLSQEELVGRSFLDFIYEDASEHGNVRALVRQKLEDVAGSEKPAQFSIGLVQVIGDGPIISLFTFEVVELADRWEMLGRAETDLSDSLLPRFVREHQRYAIGNSLTEAEELAHRLTRHLARYADLEKASYIRLGLREILINAIEHGNLEVSFDEKTETQMGGDYVSYLQERCSLSQFKGRMVRVAYSLNTKRVIYRIEDEGKGFDFDALFARIHQSQPDSDLAHGRGILMTLNIFDTVRFVAPGNVVFLVKKF